MKKPFNLAILSSLIGASCSLFGDQTIALQTNTTKPFQTQVPSSIEIYKAKDFSNLLGMPGFSDYALNTHFTLYQGYVKNTNLLLSILDQYDKEGQLKSPQYQEIKRRLMWEFDGMRLHELYFSNLGGNKTAPNANSDLYNQILKDFGSFEEWKKDFIATGGLRGIGWAILYFDPVRGRLVNAWVGEHDIGHMAGGNPIVIMDVWEHAYMLDYGIDRPAYIEAFFKNIQWPVVENRFPKLKVS